MIKNVLFVLVACAASLCSAPAVAQASGGTTYSWTGSGDGHSWGDAANWEPSTGTPGEHVGDSATIAAGGSCTTISGGPGAPLTNLSVTSSATKCPIKLVDGPFSVSGSFVWNGGTIDAPINLLAGSTSQISGSNAQTDTLDGVLDVSGNLSLSGLESNSPLYVINPQTGTPSGIHIEASGSLMGTSDARVTTQACCVAPVPLINDGKLGANGGTLTLSGVAVTQNNVVKVTNDATLVSDFGTITSPNGTYTGSGTWRLQNNATAVLSGTQTVNDGFRLELGGPAPDIGATLGGTFTLTGPGTLAWTGGDLEANLTIAHGATVDAEGVHADNGNRVLDGRDYTADGGPTAKVVNHGTLKVGGGAVITTWDAPKLVNESDGRIVLAPGSGFTSSSCCVNPAQIVNSGGTLEVTAVPDAGKTATIDGVAYRASGGTTSVAAGRTLQLSGGAAGLLSRTTITGDGTLAVATPMSDAHDVSISKQTTLNVVANGSLNGTASLSGAGSFRWTGGNISGDLTVGTAAATVSGTTHKILATVNGGTQASKLRFTAPTTFPAGTTVDLDRSALTLAGKTTMRDGVQIAQGSGVVNTGDLIIDPGKSGAVTKNYNGSLINSGTMELRSGTLTLADGLAQTRGKLDIAKGAVLDDTEDGQFTLAGGSLSGAGTFRGSVTNQATVVPGSDSVAMLTIDGDYTQTTHGALHLGFDSAKSFDTLRVTGDATVHGQAAVSNDKRFAPPFGSSHSVVSAATVSGSFSCVSTTGGGTRSTHHRKAGHWASSDTKSAVHLTWTKGAKRGC